MNTDSLAKLYDQLTARERLPLIVAAGARGDDAEQKRLSAAAPRETFTVPDYFGLGKALQHTLDLHVVTLLDLAANFWQWLGLWLVGDLKADKKADKKAGSAKRWRAKPTADEIKEFRTYGIVRYYASRFVNHFDGWRQFCAESHIEAFVQLEGQIGGQIIQSTEAHARELAFSAEEAARFVISETTPGEGPDDPERSPLAVDSPDALAKGWQAILDKLAHEWGG